MEDKFKKGVRVVYIPTHVYGDIENKDCEWGVVSSVNEKYVFVKFDPKFMRVVYITGDEDATAQACRPEDLLTEEEAAFIKGI